MIFIDIETQPRIDAANFLPDLSPPANYKDPEKIAEWLTEARFKQLKNAALDPDLGRIVCIGISHNGGEPFCIPTISEEDMIHEFWDWMERANGVTVGYNHKAFDLQFILRRSMYYGIRPSMVPDLRRFTTHPTIDLYQILYNFGTGHSLKAVAKIYGINNRFPDLSGEHVSNMGDTEMREYCMNDVQMVVDLFNKMKGYYVP